jgi:IclR family transcriptional regulator, KDG regulon repressor
MAIKQSKIIGSIQRALDILDLFDKGQAEMGTTDISKALSMPKGTVAGLVFTLEQNGYLDQNPANRKYRLGFKLAERAGVLLSQFDLRQISAPILLDLRDICNESVNLGLLVGSDVVYIERLIGTNALSMRSEIGKREKAHSTALGKAIIAYLPEPSIQKYLSTTEFISVTSKTITDQSSFLVELQRTKDRGYAIDDEENEPGGRCVAAPIFDLDCKPVAAISISVPIQRMTVSQIPAFGEQVRSSARQISRKLGASFS